MFKRVSQTANRFWIYTREAVFYWSDMMPEALPNISGRTLSVWMRRDAAGPFDNAAQMRNIF